MRYAKKQSVAHAQEKQATENLREEGGVRFREKRSEVAK